MWKPQRLNACRAVWKPQWSDNFENRAVWTRHKVHKWHISHLISKHASLILGVIILGQRGTIPCSMTRSQMANTESQHGSEVKRVRNHCMMKCREDTPRVSYQQRDNKTLLSTSTNRSYFTQTNQYFKLESSSLKLSFNEKERLAHLEKLLNFCVPH